MARKLLLITITFAVIATITFFILRRKKKNQKCVERIADVQFAFFSRPLPQFPQGSGSAIESHVTPSPVYSLTSTGNPINMMLHGLGCENLFCDPHTGEYNGIPVDSDLFSNISECEFKVYGFPGTNSAHYWTAEVTDVDDPTGNGGYICTGGAEAVQCDTPMPTDFYPDFIRMIQNLGSGQVVLNANPNNYDTTTFHDVIDDANNKTDGVAAVTDALEFESDEWLDSPLNGNAAGVRDAGSTINADLHAAYPAIRLGQDWKGMFPGQDVLNSYSSTVKDTTNVDAFRMYCSDSHLIGDMPSDLTPSQYLQMIYDGVFTEFPRQLEGIMSASGKSVFISQWFSRKEFTPIGSNFLSLSFLSLYKIKEISYEATHPNSILWSMYARVDYADMKTSRPNFQFTLMTMLKELFVEGNTVYQLQSTRANNYGIASLNDDGEGVLFFWNGNPEQVEMDELLSDCNLSLSSMRSVYTDALDSTDFTDVNDLDEVPGYSVNVLRVLHN